MLDQHFEAWMQQTFLKEVADSVSALSKRTNVRRMSPEQALVEALPYGTVTEFGNVNFVSNVKNLSSALTVCLGSQKVPQGQLTQKKKDIIKTAPDTARAVVRYLERAPLLQVDCSVGQGSDFSLGCRVFVSSYRKDSVRLAHMTCKGFFPPCAHSEPDLTLIVVPEWQEKDRQVLVFPEIGVTIALGTDYYGEIKNALLRMAMWQAKQSGMLGLHAGTQLLQAVGADSKPRRIGLIMFGIAATGKTTHSCHDHGMSLAGESVRIAQDDVVFWRRDGAALGSERAFYIKTEGLNPDDQPLLYHAAVQEDTILENVMVDFEGNVFFDDRTLTPNGHAIAMRHALGDRVSESADLPPVSELDRLIIAFMTRCYTVVPVAARLSPEQAAVAFVLSESLDASGSDQQAAPASSAGSNPLIIGDASEECNIFYRLLKAHEDKIECYMLNTGGVGELVEHQLDGAKRVARKVKRIQISEMAAIIRGIARGTIRWKDDSEWMVQTPSQVEGIDISKFHLHAHYSQEAIDSLIAEIRRERAAYVENFRGLEAPIRNAVEF